MNRWEIFLLWLCDMIIKVKHNVKYLIFVRTWIDILKSQFIFLCFDKLINKLSSPVPISFDHKNQILVQWWTGNRERMPLKPWDRWNIDECILTRLDWIVFGFLDVEHYKLFALRQWDINDLELSTHSILVKSNVIPDHNDHEHGNCNDSQWESPVKPIITPMDHEKCQKHRHSKYVNSWKHLETLTSYFIQWSNSHWSNDK